MELFLSTHPGLEAVLAEEADRLGLPAPSVQAGGVTTRGDWEDLYRANLWLRTASHVLVRLTEFRALHLAQLDKRLRRIDWTAHLPSQATLRIEAQCRRSRIYHEKAAKQRLINVLADQLGARLAREDEPTDQRVLLRIEDDLCTISLDSSGEPLHRRGLKPATVKAPLRETLAAGFLGMMGFAPGMAVVDPMCGSGTFPLTAAEIAAGWAPGRARRFAFQDWPGVDAARFAALQSQTRPSHTGPALYFGQDRDQGAVQAARRNAEEAGLAPFCRFEVGPISTFAPPDTPPGLVMVNPPYGARIGNKKLLYALYASLGDVLQTRFGGWRVGLVTSEPGLAKATGLRWDKISPPLPHGGLRIALYQTGPLG